MSSLPDSYTPVTASGLSQKPTGADAEATKAYGLSHTMIRIKDPKVSLPFYTEVLGMTLVYEMPMEAGKFTNYFLLYPQSPIPADEDEKYKWIWSQQGIVELCHNWGTELESSDFKGHKSGNEPEHKGFGHLCIYVDDLYKACERFEAKGVRFIKKPQDGRMKFIAFIADPDG